MSEKNNPAGRLRAILVAGKKQDRGLRADKVWAKLLRVNDGDDSTLLYRLGHVLALPSEIERGLTQISDMSHERYVRWVPKVKRSLSNLNLGQKWATFIDPIDDAVLEGLDICSDRLSRLQPERTLNEDRLSHILQEAKVLFDEVLASDIDERLRRYLLKHLEAVTRAIEEYDIQGGETLETAFQSWIGSLPIHPNVYRDTKRTDVGKKFWDLMNRVAMVIGIVGGMMTLVERATNLLPIPDQTYVEVNRTSDGADEPVGQVEERDLPQR